MKYFKKLIGERIYLSPKGTSEEEIQKFTEWLNDFQITDYLGRSGQITTLNTEKEWLENATQKNASFVNVVMSRNFGTSGQCFCRME